MLVTFHTKAFADTTMFGDVAIKLLRLMGHSGTIPSAIAAEDIPDALRRLKEALAEQEGATADQRDRDEQEEAEEEAVSLKNRAYPLIQLLEAAQKTQVPVMWDK
jgi:hypothetical protein